MKDQIIKAFRSVKDYWQKLSPKRRKVILIAGGGILAASIALVAYMHTSSAKMVTLFPALSSTETTAVCSVLAEMGTNAEINARGEIMVPAEQQGEIQVQLAGRGFPQSAPIYDIYLNNTGFTRTESEKRQIMIYQLQEGIRGSLMQSKGVKNVTVLLTIPEDSGYLWEDNKGESSASLTIMMEPGYELSAERASAIKNLVAFSVTPQMSQNNVKVIDASTGIEVMTDDSALASLGLDLKRLDFEARVQKKLEDNVRRLLAPIYGAEGVTVVAAVTLDYDKMLTEQHQLVPEDNGEGVKTHQEEQFNRQGTRPAEGIAGEENNTDTPIPTYPNLTGQEEGEILSSRSSVDWETSYINTQIEKGQAILKEATISVIVQDNEFDQQKSDDLTEMVSKAVNLQPSAISVKNYNLTPPATIPVDTPPDGELDPRILIAAAAAGVSLLILLILLAIFLRRRAKRRAAAEEFAVEHKLREQQAEIERHKRTLVENAQAGNDSKEAAITEEIRKFSQQNPEITANLIRSMMKEDE